MSSRKQFTILIVGLILCIPITAYAQISTPNNLTHVSVWHRELYAAGLMSTCIWMLAAIVYIGAVDTKRRWPHLKGFFNRLGVAFMFDERREDARAKQFRQQYPKGE